MTRWKIVEHNRGGNKSYGEVLVSDKPKAKRKPTVKKKAEVLEPA